MIVPLMDHLWQSTLFAAMAGLMTLFFRNNGAGVRYGLWFAASMKFLIPFAVLTMLGRMLLTPLHPAARLSPLICDVQPATQPFLTAAEAVTAPSVSGVPFLPILVGIWALGSAAVLIAWGRRWSLLRKALRSARNADIAAPLPIKYTPADLEPGLVGIWRPVLLMPEGIGARLTPQEMQAIVNHELGHLRRRDNLMAALHMIVEALFWFHPLVWWLGARLIEERECACDESVLAQGVDPETYAQGILKVCQFYLRSPLASASGVSGADLKKRLETIMENRAVLRLNGARKAVLGLAALLITMAPPLIVGLIGSQAAPAEASVPPAPLSIDTRQFDKYVGYYRLPDGAILHVTRDGDRYFVRQDTQRPVEIIPGSAASFFSRTVPAELSFETDRAGTAIGALWRQGRHGSYARRIAKPGPAASKDPSSAPQRR